jgi:hypothetical protein
MDDDEEMRELERRLEEWWRQKREEWPETFSRIAQDALIEMAKELKSEFKKSTDT